MAAYADAVILMLQRSPAADDAQAERRRAQLALTNLQAAVQRSLTEIGGNADSMAAMLRASAALQRLSNTLNMLVQIAPMLPSPAPAFLVRFRTAFVPALADPGRNEAFTAKLRAAVPVPGHSPEAAILCQALDRLASALKMLDDAFVAGERRQVSGSPAHASEPTPTSRGGMDGNA